MPPPRPGATNAFFNSMGSASKMYMTCAASCVVLIALSSFTASAYLFAKGNEEYVKITGKVRASSCRSTDNNNTRCDIEVSFSPEEDPDDSEPRLASVETNRSYAVGADIDLEYPAGDPSKVRACCAPANTTVAAVLSAVGLCLLCVGSVQYSFRNNRAVGGLLMTRAIMS